MSDDVFLSQYDEMGMVDAVATRNPVSLAFEVTSDFMQYSEGVYTRWAEVSQILSLYALRNGFVKFYTFLHLNCKLVINKHIGYGH